MRQAGLPAHNPEDTTRVEAMASGRGSSMETPSFVLLLYKEGYNVNIPGDVGSGLELVPVGQSEVLWVCIHAALRLGPPT